MSTTAQPIGSVSSRWQGLQVEVAGAAGWGCRLGLQVGAAGSGRPHHLLSGRHTCNRAATVSQARNQGDRAEGPQDSRLKATSATWRRREELPRPHLLSSIKEGG